MPTALTKRNHAYLFNDPTFPYPRGIKQRHARQGKLPVTLSVSADNWCDLWIWSNVKHNQRQRVVAHVDLKRENAADALTRLGIVLQQKGSTSCLNLSC